MDDYHGRLRPPTLHSRFHDCWQYATSVLVQSPVCFRPIDETITALSYTWLTDPEIKRLTDSPEITPLGHRAWMAQLGSREEYAAWGVWHQGKPVGVVGLKHITADSAEYFGYFGEKSLWGQGLGQWLLRFTEACSIRLGLQRLYLKVIRDNCRAIKAYSKYGYRVVSESSSHIYMELYPLSLQRALGK